MVMVYVPSFASLEQGDMLMVEHLHKVQVVRKSAKSLDPEGPGLRVWVAHEGRMDGFSLFADAHADGREPKWYRKSTATGGYERVSVTLVRRAYRPPRKEILAELGDSDEIADWVSELL